MSVIDKVGTGIFVIGAAGVGLGLMVLITPVTDGDLARANYVESQATVASISQAPGDKGAVTTADDVTVGASSSVCPTAAVNPAVGDTITVATLVGVEGLRSVSMVGPCDPVSMTTLIDYENTVFGIGREVAPYNTTMLPKEVGKGSLFGGLGVIALGVSVLGAGALAERRSKVNA